MENDRIDSIPLSNGVSGSISKGDSHSVQENESQIDSLIDDILSGW